MAIIANITPAAPSDKPNTAKLYAFSISTPPEVRLTSPTFDLMLETSFCKEDSAFFKAPISPAEDEPEVGGNSIHLVLQQVSQK